MEWDSLRAFLEVARTGSLTRAARALSSDEDAVGRRIELLEYQLGIALFERMETGLTPTEPTRKLIAIAESMEEAANAFIRLGAAEANSTSGTVRVTAGDVMAIEVLPALIGELKATYPDLVIELEVDNDQRRRLSSAAHIAVCMFEPNEKGLISHYAGPVHVGVYAHRRYLERAGTPVAVADLKHHTLLGSQDETQAIRFMGALGLHLTERDFKFRTDSQIGHVAALRAGVGIGVCQAPLADRDPDLVRLLPAVLDFTMPAWVAMHDDVRNSRAVKIVFNAMVEHLTAYVGGEPRAVPAPQPALREFAPRRTQSWLMSRQ